MELAHFNDDAGLVPLSRVWADLVLDPHVVSDFKWGEGDGVLGKTLRIFHMSVTESFLSRL